MRSDPPFSADERTMLISWLDYHRETLAEICAGLTPRQLATCSVAPSDLSLLGLVRHLAKVESTWFVARVAGIDSPPRYSTEADADADLHVPAVTAAELALLVDDAFTVWRAAIDQADEILAGVASLDEEFLHARDGVMISVRWLLVHMIEEYARHNGHADLLREAIDGRTGI
jgi:hypothetical protein